MSVTLGDGTISGLISGGLPTGSVTGSDIIDSAITLIKLNSSQWTSTIAATGSQRLPNGMIIKWGPAITTTATTADWKSGTITFGSAFPTSCIVVVTSLDASAASVTANAYAAAGADTWTTTNFRSLIRKFTSDANLVSSYYIAVGY